MDLLMELSQHGVRRATAGEPMERHTSWRIGGPADYLCVAESEAALLGAIEVAQRHDLPWLVLGGGNNILVADAGIEGLVILNRLRTIAVEQDAGGPLLVCGAGVFFARAAQFSARHGFTGMEWGIAIPGTVGGGVVNNAGAHASDVSQALVSTTVVQPSGQQERLEPKELAYRYRQSALKQPHTRQSGPVVTEVAFRLAPDLDGQAAARVEELRLHRLRTQPVKEASAGSTFKNPDGGYAGALIEAAGLKGYRLGGAQISPLHANFILNVDHARADEVLALMRLSQHMVAERFGIQLEPEVQFVGRWPKAGLASVLGSAA